MTGPARVVCVGEVMVDVLAELSGPLAIGSDRPGRIHTAGGGSAANTACWLAVTGRSATLIARVGHDLTGLESVPADLELALTHDPVRPVGRCLVLVAPDGERTMVPDAGANAALTPQDVSTQHFAPGRHLHLSGYLLFGPARPAALHALDLARAAGMSISVDASSAGPLEQLGPETFFALIGPNLTLLANADEARVLTGLVDDSSAVRRLAERAGEAIVKLGPDGAAWSDGDSAEHRPTVVQSPRDTTGAGDAFAAGWLAARGQGHTPARALELANQLAGSVCGQLGGRPPS